MPGALSKGSIVHQAEKKKIKKWKIRLHPSWRVTPPLYKFGLPFNLGTLLKFSRVKKVLGPGK